MAVYKVAQDVEADDKLLGPFSFRQFVYLIIVAIAIALAWGLSQLFIPLAVIPLPIILFFGALALPLRKDQPMEVYLAAILSYYIKPRRRIWQADGIDSLIEITAPKTVERHLMKDLSQTEAERRLSYLADIADTRGWAVRHTAAIPDTGSSMAPDMYFEAQQTVDILDADGQVGQSLGTMISQNDERRREEMIARMRQASVQPPTPVNPAPPSLMPQPTTYTEQPIIQPANAPQIAPTPYQPMAPTQTTQPVDTPNPVYNPYPHAIHQQVIQPLDSSAQLVDTTPIEPAAPAPMPAEPTLPQNPPADTSANTVSPDIISLANNSDLSIETISREAHRIEDKKHAAQKDEDEVFISLR